eukprot:UN22983
MLDTIDEFLYPDIKKYVEAMKKGEIDITFIIGHARSGTTFTHKTLTRLNCCTSSLMMDFLGSPLLKHPIFAWPFTKKWFLQIQF